MTAPARLVIRSIRRGLLFASLLLIEIALAGATWAAPLANDDILLWGVGTTVVDSASGDVNGLLTDGGGYLLYVENVAVDSWGNAFALAQGQTYRIDRTDLSTTPVGFAFPSQIDAQGRLYTDVGGSPVMIDPGTGSPGAAGPTGMLISVDDPLNAFMPDGDLITLDPNTATITRTDSVSSNTSVVTSGGLLTVQGNAYPQDSLSPVAIETAADGTIFALSYLAAQYPEGALTRVDPGTGAQTQVGFFGSEFIIQDLEVDGNGDPIVYTEANGVGGLFRYDGLGGGEMELADGQLGMVTGFRVMVTPEPGTGLLLGLGLAGLACRRNRRRDC